MHLQQLHWLEKQAIVAILGSLATFSLTLVVIWFQQRGRLRTRIVGNWLSSYQGIEEPEGTWITEKVRITRTINVSDGGVRNYRFVNRESSRGYAYVALGKLSKDDYLIGDWDSTKPDSTSNCGIFVLCVAPKRNLLCGYWSGLVTDGAHKFGRWVLVKDTHGSPSVDEARTRLEKMRHPADTIWFPDYPLPGSPSVTGR